ncbi:MAG TPA: glycosyltransferase, partial [Vicinamibacteria bacterium]|nr:glycosyltransferase [Vicinamibacteria bacterium]
GHDPIRLPGDSLREGSFMTAAAPLVSVVIPTLNQGRYVGAALDSILKQDYSNIETIVIDGGSTDNTLDVLKNYPGRIVWKSDKDRNMTEAIIKGIRLSQGAYIKPLASDEVLYEGAITQLVGAACSAGAAVVVGNGSIIDEASNDLAPIDNGGGLEFEEVVTLVKKMPLACSLFERRVFEEFPLDEELSLLWDFDLWMRVFPRIKIAFISQKIGKWRRHPEAKSVMLEVADQILAERRQVLDRFFSENPGHRHLRKPAYVGASWDWALVHINAEKVREALTILRASFARAPLATLRYDKGIIPRAVYVMARRLLAKPMARAAPLGAPAVRERIPE